MIRKQFYLDKVKQMISGKISCTSTLAYPREATVRSSFRKIYSPKQHIHAHPESFGTKYSSQFRSVSFGEFLLLIGLEAMTSTSRLSVIFVVTSQIEKKSAVTGQIWFKVNEVLNNWINTD